MTLASWPALPFRAWRDTAVTLQLWTQIVGKVRLSLSPWLNHSWQVPLYVSWDRAALECPLGAPGRVRPFSEKTP
jgi:Family of unknown function (DUF5996)